MAEWRPHRGWRTIADLIKITYKFWTYGTDRLGHHASLDDGLVKALDEVIGGRHHALQAYFDTRPLTMFEVEGSGHAQHRSGVCRPGWVREQTMMLGELP